MEGRWLSAGAALCRCWGALAQPAGFGVPHGSLGSAGWLGTAGMAGPWRGLHPCFLPRAPGSFLAAPLSARSSFLFFFSFSPPEENSIVLFLVVTARLLAATSLCSLLCLKAAGGSLGVGAAGGPRCACRWSCAAARCRRSASGSSCAWRSLAEPDAAVHGLFHVAARRWSGLLPLTGINELLAPPRVDKSPRGWGGSPRISGGGAGLWVQVVPGGSCNPSPPSAPPPSPSESWERFWFLGSWTTSCQEHKWQLAFGACWVGKGNRYGRVRVRPWRGAGPPAQWVPASCSSSPGWANCFHGRVWVTWGSAQGAARSGCPHCPQTSGCGWGGSQDSAPGCLWWV